MSLIIGTAGHVDHGKTSLIKALTGTDTDRLKEEKKRGITIEPGFAFLTLPGGEKAGIVDVPGHEKFIKNMLAGAVGTDLVLFAIAADEGVMPQTCEHLEILELLGARLGIVVLTKCDAVDREWLDVITAEIRERLAGSFLENAPYVEVSAHTGLGIEELRELIFELLSGAAGKSSAGPVCLPIDRVFSVSGFGTVVTGTLASGVIKKDDELMLYPAEIPVRARNIQIHSQAADRAEAGNRTAVNLVSSSKVAIKKGDIAATPGSLFVTRTADVRVKITPGCDREISSGSRLHFHYGTANLLCKIILPGGKSLAAGESSYARLRFDEPVAIKKGDRFVLRFYSPVLTVGGGVVLDPVPSPGGFGSPKLMAELEIKEHGSPAELALRRIYELGSSYVTKQKLAEDSAVAAVDFESLTAQGVREGTLAEISDRYIFHTDFLAEQGSRLKKFLGEYHAAHPLSRGVRRDSLKNTVFFSEDLRLTDALIDYYAGTGDIKTQDGRIFAAEFKVTPDERQKRARAAIEKALGECGCAPLEKQTLIPKSPAEQKTFEAVLAAMADDEEILPVDNLHIIHTKKLAELKKLLADRFAANPEITLAEFRDMTGTSRKYALLLLEYFDRRGITRKTGDVRTAGKNFRI